MSHQITIENLAAKTSRFGIASEHHNVVQDGPTPTKQLFGVVDIPGESISYVLIVGEDETTYETLTEAIAAYNLA